jgi:hypothetical protein
MPDPTCWPERRNGGGDSIHIKGKVNPLKKLDPLSNRSAESHHNPPPSKGWRFLKRVNLLPQTPREPVPVSDLGTYNLTHRVPEAETPQAGPMRDKIKDNSVG